MIKLFLMITLCLQVSCLNNKPSKPSLPDKVKYNSPLKLLNIIANKYATDTIEFTFTLYEHEEFKELVDSTEEYKKDLIKILQDSSQSRVVKQIAIYGLHRLCIQEYITVLRVLYSEYTKNRIDVRLLMSAISQDGFSFEVYKNYNNIKLNQFLLEVKGNYISNNMPTEDLDYIISGEGWHKLSTYYKEMNWPLPWLCK